MTSTLVFKIKAIHIKEKFNENVFVDINYYSLYYKWGRREIGISGSLIWSKTQMELIFNPSGEFR